MAQVLTRAVDIATPRTLLKPCILSGDGAHLELLSSVIGEMGYEAVPTSDPEEALQLVKLGRCPLVFTDMQVLGIGRTSLYRYFKRHSVGAKTRVAAGTALA